MKSRYAERTQDQGPGLLFPGQDISAAHKRSPAFTIRTRPHTHQDVNSPGPAYYDYE